jgi:hypothetical protein
MDLAIGRSSSEARPGDFGAKVEGGQLLLPGGVVDLFAAQGVRSAAELLSWLEAFPSAVAAEMRWNPTDVGRATARVRALLRNHMDAALMADRPRGPVRVYGALDPRRLNVTRSAS